jgi:lactoylglutathione lyase
MSPKIVSQRHDQRSEPMLDIERTGLILHTERYQDCVRFYRNVIGLQIEFEKDEPEQVLTCLRLGDGYLMIELGGWAKDAVKSRHENPVTVRLNVTDVHAAADILRSQGVEVAVSEFGWGTIGRFRDPDGNPCQLRDQPLFCP